MQFILVFFSVLFLILALISWYESINWLDDRFGLGAVLTVGISLGVPVSLLAALIYGTSWGY